MIRPAAIANHRQVPRCRTIATFLIATLLLLLSHRSVTGAEGGYSNYIPGTYGDFAAAVEPPSTWTIRNDFYYYGADGGRSVRSGLLELDTELEFFMDFLTVLYKPEVEILGAHYATGIFLPLVYADIDSRISVGNLVSRQQDDVFALGDLTVIPGVFFWNYGNFHFTLAEYVVTPTGKYDSDDLVNAGLNYFTSDTSVAATYLNPKTGQDYSINFGYNYNTENPDTDYKSGQEIHIDYMVNQFLSESWAIGIHGFYLNQITGDRGAGAVLGDFKAEAAGIGPALLWNTKIGKQEISFIAKWLHEFHAERRLEGDHVFLSVAASF